MSRWGGHNFFSIFKADRYLHVYTHIMNAHSLLLTLVPIFFSFFLLLLIHQSFQHTTYNVHIPLYLVFNSVIYVIGFDHHHYCYCYYCYFCYLWTKCCVATFHIYLYQFHPYLNFLVSPFHLSRLDSHYFKFFQHFVHWFSQSALLVDGSHLKYTVSSWHESLFRILYTQKCLSSEFASILKCLLVWWCWSCCCCYFMWLILLWFVTERITAVLSCSFSLAKIWHFVSENWRQVFGFWLLCCVFNLMRHQLLLTKYKTTRIIYKMTRKMIEQERRQKNIWDDGPKSKWWQCFSIINLVPRTTEDVHTMTVCFSNS